MATTENVCLRYYAQKEASNNTKFKENSITAISSQLFRSKEKYWVPYFKKKERTSNVIHDCSCICYENGDKNNLYTGQRRRNILKSSNLLKMFYSAKAFNAPEVTTNSIIEQTNTDFSKEEIVDMIGPGKSDLNNVDGYLSLIVNEFLKDTNVSLSYWVFRIAGYVACKYILPYLVRGLIVNLNEIALTKKMVEYRIPVIYVLRYSSVYDSFLVNLILFLNNIRIPIAFAYKGQAQWLLSKILKKVGVLYVTPYAHTRGGEFSSEEVILQEFLLSNVFKGNHLLLPISNISKGENDEYAEAVFSIMIEAIRTSNIADDVLIVPVSVINEVNTSLQTVQNPSRGIWHKLCNIFKKKQIGLTTVTFHTAFTLSEVTDPAFDGEFIMNHVLTDSAKCQIITCTNVVSFILLYKRREGTTFSDLCDEFEITVNELLLSKRDVGFNGRNEDIVSYALRLLDDLVIKEEINGEVILKANTEFPFISQLSKYSKAVADNFVLEALIAYYSTWVVEKEGKDAYVHQSDIVDMSSDFAGILMYEFSTVKVCQCVPDILNETFDNLVFQGVFVSTEEELLEEEQWAQRFANNFAEENNEAEEEGMYLSDDADGDEEEECTVPVYTIHEPPRSHETKYMISTEEGHRKKIECYTNMIKGYVDVYLVSASYLITMMNRVVLQEDYINGLYELLLYYLNEGFITYPEAVSKETIKNSLKWLESSSLVRSFHYNGDMFYCMTPRADLLESIQDKIAYIYSPTETF